MNLHKITTMNAEGITDFADFKNRAGLYIKQDEDFEIEVSCTITPYIPATHWEPAEGGTLENLCVYVFDIDITDLLTSSEVERLEDFLIETQDISDELYWR